MTQWSNLETLDFKNTHVLIFPKLPPSLKHLILDESFSPKHMRRMDEVIYSLPLLETLSLQRNDIEVSTIWEITRSCIQANKLKTLLCGKFDCDSPHETPVHEYLPPSSTLEELSLELAPINDEDILAIIKLYPNLKKINLSQTRVTQISIDALVKAGVKSINLDGCLKVPTRFVAMAREEGVNISMETMNGLYPIGDYITKQVYY
ncbi:hypothetical protein BGHDH14_bghG002353000001001 [Blumeria hordei DH14]|uniref:Uncharacterized protein n=1 Tax=Blumeria graminis f. sp. hordei (strain DH14) TaxID=546991 RepID=N1JEY4_BLUG1|nr:hypothetical protein BGHDH14_bghG002353000001001 [Blumeria hordei DH14]